MVDTTDDERRVHEGATRSPSGSGAAVHDHEAVCGLCPVCAVIGSVTSARPEVAAHLLAAARELVAAMTAALDAYPGAPPGSTTAAGTAGSAGPDDLRRIAVE